MTHKERFLKTLHCGKISFCGNIDIRILEQNDLAALDAELENKIRPVLEAGSGYILHTDHLIPPAVNYETLRHFFEYGRTISGQI